jgi:hypothetical protein
MPILILLLCGFVLYAIVQYGRHRAIKMRRAKLLAWAQPYVKDQCFISVDASSLIGFDFQEKQVFLACSSASGKYRFDEIASCELLRDDVSLTQTNRGSQVLGAVGGGLLLGTAGALVGSLTGSKRSRSRIAKLELKLVVDCQENPVYRIVLFTSEDKKGAKPNDSRLRPHLEIADRFHGHVINAMRNSDRETRHALVTASQQPLISAGVNHLQNLKELFELKQMGAINEEEYERAKMKALDSQSVNIPPSPFSAE